MAYQSTHTGQQVDDAIDKALSADAVPTSGSTNLVESGGVASAVSAVQNTVSRRNLLDNWYFVGGGSQQGGGQFPINQRGSASYSGSGGGYFIDRWKRINSITCSLQSDCLQLTNTNWGMRQVVGLPPGTYTFSMLARKLTYPSGGSMGFNSYNNIGSNWEITGNDWGLYTETFTTQNDLGNANLQFNANLGSYSIEILAMKLELGSTQTLAHQENGAWVLNEIPNYAEELAKCQYYFCKIKANEALFGRRSVGNPKYAAFQIPVRMRATPSASLGTGSATIYGQSGATYTFSSFDNSLVDYNAIGVFLTGNATYAGEVLTMWSTSGISLSADL